MYLLLQFYFGQHNFLRLVRFPFNLLGLQLFLLPLVCTLFDFIVAPRMSREGWAKFTHYSVHFLLTWGERRMNPWKIINHILFSVYPDCISNLVLFCSSSFLPSSHFLPPYSSLFPTFSVRFSFPFSSSSSYYVLLFLSPLPILPPLSPSPSLFPTTTSSSLLPTC